MTSSDAPEVVALERAAAFFDLDKTVIARASMAAFRAPLRRYGLLSPSALARAAVGQLVYLHLGAREERMWRLTESLLRLAAGWEQAEVAQLVDETLELIVDPIIYAEALELIELHHASGDLVVIVSASPIEIVAPLGRHLGVDAVLATRAALDANGRYTGEIASYVHGANKAAEIRAFAAASQVDLTRSFAYGDSAGDLAMLEAVGHPVAVNPDRLLRRTATERGWEIRRFENPVPLRERIKVSGRRPVRLAGGALASLLVATAVAWAIARTRARRLARPVAERSARVEVG